MKKIIHLLTITFVCLLWQILPIKAQNYCVSSMGLGEGLSCNYVVSMAQDKNGFLWFATEEGLNRFDGEQFFSYYKSRKNTNSISSSELNCLLDDPKKPWLWIGTKNDGLNVYDYDTDTFKTFKHKDGDSHSIATNDITDLSASTDGNIWVTTYWKGVEYLNTETGIFTHYNHQTVKGMPDSQLWCVEDLGNGIIAVGHVRAGFTIIDTHNHTAHNYRHSPTESNSIASDEINSIFKDRNGTIWVGTSNGIDIFDQVNQSFIHIAQQELNNHRIYVSSSLPMEKSGLATEMNGIIVIDANKKLYSASQDYPYTTIKEGTTEYTLTGNSVRSILQDKYNNVWVGLYGNGINFLTITRPPFSILSYDSKDTIYHLSEKSVMGLARDRDGNLWVGTDGDGINVFSADMKRIGHYPQEAGRNVLVATTDSQGTLWFGSFNKGAFVKKPTGSFQKLALDNTIDIRCFYEDKKQQMWIGTSDGIYIVDTKTLQQKQHFEVGNKFVRTICQDKQGRIWVGYFGNGIEVFTPNMKKIQSFNSKDKGSRTLPSNSINQLYLDYRGQMWAASNEGAICIDTQKMTIKKIYDKSNGLNNEHIRGMVEDKQHNLWMSTNMGISCMDSKEHFYNYTNKDNVPQANFNDQSVLVAPDGTIYMGSSQGLCYFNPEYVRKKLKAPKVFITSLTIMRGIEKNDSTLNLINKQQVSLAHSENTFSLTFNVQNYAIERYVEYSYLLQGMQRDWITTTDGRITLHDIPAGKYKLQVRSRLHNQEWSEEIAELTITIRPPFWLSWWAKLIYVLLFIGATVASLRIYKRHLRLEYLLRAEKINHEQEVKLNEERLRFFTNITHELRTPLTLILGPLDDISHSGEINKHIKHKLAIIHQSAQRLNELITQILEFRKTETGNRQLKVTKGNIVDAVHEISLKYEELAQKPNVGFRFVAPENPIDTYYDQDVIRTIVDNLVSNAIKYTDKGNIDISVERRRSQDKHLIDITISDTGHGISKHALPHIFDRYYQENGKHQASGTGIGLSLVKKLVALHEGEIIVESSLEEGTSFIFTIDENNVYPHAIHEKTGPENNAPSLATELTQEDTDEGSGMKLEKNDEGNDKKPLLLIVEDNKEILNYIADSFAEEFDTLTANDGREGLATALDKTPDIIISDIMMPNMDGNKMCRMLKSDIRTSHIPIILLTAKDSLEAKEEGYDSGADSYITKPFTHSLLSSRIKNLLLQRKRSLQVINNSQTTDLSEKKELLRESLNKLDQEFFDKMNKIIEENISGDVDVNLLATKLATSTSTLYRKMKSMTGISTNEYIRKYKMQYAEHLLLEGKYTISEISFMVGMNSIAYFRKCFKDEYGLIPSEYLKKLKSENEGNE